jgi:hypothetical protein
MAMESFESDARSKYAHQRKQGGGNGLEENEVRWRDPVISPATANVTVLLTKGDENRARTFDGKGGKTWTVKGTCSINNSPSSVQRGFVRRLPHICRRNRTC